MPEDQVRNCGGNNCSGGMFNGFGRGCDCTLLFFIIVFLLLFCCGGNNNFGGCC